MNSYTINNIDPLNVNINKTLTLDSLKSKYVSLRNMYHPDKGGSTQMFNLVNDALKKQLLIIKSRVEDKTFNQLKTDFNNYKEEKKKATFSRQKN